MRRLFMWHPGLKAVRDRTRVERGKYQCDSCCHIFGPKQMHMDHIQPAVELWGWRDFGTFAARLLDAVPDGIQHICHDCHARKTAAEREVRKGYKEAQRLDHKAS